MKKIFLILLCFITFIQGCSRSEYSPLEQENLEAEINLPKSSQEFGKKVSKEMRAIALNLSNKGIDYTQANRSTEVKKQVIQELFKDIPVESNVKPSSAPLEDITSLTAGQQKIISEISNELKIKKSDKKFFEKLKSINKSIYKLPVIEQERIFNLSATLYYGLKEAQKLREEGLMAPEGGNSSDIPRLKAFSENGEGSNGNTGQCIKAESLASVAVGREIIIQGVKYIVKEAAYAAARSMWIFTACLLFTSDTPDYHARCRPYVDACIEKNSTLPYNQKMDCTSCYGYCTQNYGQWDTRCNVNGWL